MNLLNYLETRGITEELYLSKQNDGSEITTARELRKFIQNSQDVSISDLRKMANVVFIYKNIAYVSNRLIIPEFMLKPKHLKSIINAYSKNDLLTERFLNNGLFIFDVNTLNITNSFVSNMIGVDVVNHIILFMNQYDAKSKISQKLKDVVFLDTDDLSNIDEDLLSALLGSSIDPLSIFDNEELLKNDLVFDDEDEYEYEDNEYHGRFTDDAIEIAEEYDSYYD